MKKLIEYLDNHPTEKYVIIFDDLARFARDLEVHLKLRKELIGRGAKLECLNFNFEDSPEGIFIENVLASKAQLDRQQNRRQVIQKMKARLEGGYWPFMLPFGLINKKDAIHGKLAIPREPYASIYKEAIEKYRDWILPTVLDVQAFIKDKYKEFGINHKMPNSTANHVLRTILYAGYIEYPKWGVSRMKAKHEGFISLDTYEAVQARLEGRAKPWHRKDYHLDFPLRPYVLCDACEVPMSASYNTARGGKRYPHYYCRGAGCKYVWKTLRKTDFEKQFEALLSQVKPADEYVDLTKDVFLETWDNRVDNYSLRSGTMQSDADKVTEELEDYVKRVGKTDDETLVRVYEKKIKELANKQEDLEGKLKKSFYSDKDFGTASEKVLNTLKKPMSLWKSDDYADKRIILFMYFEEQLRYDYKRGFGTAGLAYPIKLISKIGQAQNRDVEMSMSDIESE